MLRLAVLFGATGAGLLALVALNWWVDPLAEHYRRGVVSEAFAASPHCDVSTAILSDTTWPTFKLDLFTRRRTTTIVAGSSRIWKIGPRPGERGFTNVGLPGMSVTSVPILFRRLHSLAPNRHLRVYLGVEPFWFTIPDRSSNFAPTPLHERIRLLASGETLRATFDELVHHPGNLVDPPSRRAPDRLATPAGCTLDAGGGVRSGAANAWAMDGTFLYNYELSGTAPGRKDFLRGDFTRMRGSTLDRASVGDVREALALAKQYGWDVVGFTAPFSHNTIVRLERDTGGAALLDVYRSRIPTLFRDAGFPYLDLMDARSVPCTDDEFLRHDGAHANATCAAKVRARLDAVSSR
jgi:hypothetical protein